MDKRFTHLKAIRYFSVASQTGNYTLAADQLHVSQAAVSQQMRLLEAHLGCKLFYRDGREMRLTAQGNILADYVERAFSTLQQGLDHVRSEPTEGVLSITALQSFSSLWLMPRLWRFSAMHQDITVKIIASDIKEDLRAGHIDMAIRSSSEDYEGISKIELTQSPIIPVCSPDLAHSIGFKNLEDLFRCWLIQVEHPDYSWRSWFAMHGLKAPPETRLWAEVNSWYMGISAVKAGHGVFLCPVVMVEDELKSGALVQPFQQELPTRLAFNLYYANHSPRLARIKTFEKWLLDEFAGRIVDPYQS